MGCVPIFVIAWTKKFTPNIGWECLSLSLSRPLGLSCSRLLVSAVLCAVGDVWSRTGIVRCAEDPGHTWKHTSRVHVQNDRGRR